MHCPNSFRLFPETTVFKKLVTERSLEKPAKPDSKKGRSEASGSCAWHLLGTYRSAHPVPDVRLKLLLVCSWFDVGVTYPACAMCVQVNVCVHVELNLPLWDVTHGLY